MLEEWLLEFLDNFQDPGNDCDTSTVSFIVLGNKLDKIYSDSIDGESTPSSRDQEQLSFSEEEHKSDSDSKSGSRNPLDKS